MSIQMITLRNESATFNRRADAKIGLLKEIIERIKNGEDVNVEGLLGTGNPQREKEWEEGIGRYIILFDLSKLLTTCSPARN